MAVPVSLKHSSSWLFQLSIVNAGLWLHRTADGRTSRSLCCRGDFGFDIRRTLVSNFKLFIAHAPTIESPPLHIFSVIAVRFPAFLTDAKNRVYRCFQARLGVFYSVYNDTNHSRYGGNPVLPPRSPLAALAVNQAQYDRHIGGRGQLCYLLTRQNIEYSKSSALFLSRL